jgi:hypothetical protein
MGRRREHKERRMTPFQLAKELGEYLKGIMDSGDLGPVAAHVFELLDSGSLRERLPCFGCGEPSDHDHHVVPGGKQTVPLCSRCHGIVHDVNRMSTPMLTRQGLARARERGVALGGRVPPGMLVSSRWRSNPEEVALVKRRWMELTERSVAMRAGSMSWGQIAKELGLARSTCRYLVERNPGGADPKASDRDGGNL